MSELIGRCEHGLFEMEDNYSRRQVCLQFWQAESDRNSSSLLVATMAKRGLWCFTKQLRPPTAGQA